MSDTKDLGNDALMGEGAEVLVEGKKYTFKRLGIKETMHAVKLLKQAISYGYHDLSFLTNLTETLSAQKKENLLGVASVLFGMTDIQDDLFKWVASVMQDEEGNTLTLDDLYDANRFPMYSILDILVGFLGHQDLVSFFTRLIAVVDKMIPQITKLADQIAGSQNSRD
jgi:hypothetical protein